MQLKVIAALGDSITQGYVDEQGLGWFGRLGARISEQTNIWSGKIFGFHNISMAGDRICDSWHRFASQCMTMDINVLIIAVGCNDTVRRGAPDAPLDLSPALRARYWEWLLDDARKNIETIIVLDVLPIREETNADNNTGTGADGYQYNRDIQEYNRQLAGICATRNIPFIRRYDKWENLNLSDYYVDFGHPNGRGHQKIADEVYTELEKLGILKV